MKTLALTLGLIFAQNALATGETSCSVKTKDIAIEAYTLNSRLPGSPVLSAAVEVTVMNSAGNSVKFTKDDLVGWWSHGHDLKIHFMIPAQGNDLSDTQLIINTKYSEEGYDYSYMGTAEFIGPQGAKFIETTFCELG